MEPGPSGTQYELSGHRMVELESVLLAEIVSSVLLDSVGMERSGRS